MHLNIETFLNAPTRAAARGYKLDVNWIPIARRVCTLCEGKVKRAYSNYRDRGVHLRRDEGI